MHTMEGKIPGDFFKKYFSIQGVDVFERVDNHEHLFEFLKNFDYLTHLSVHTNLLDESFYNRLGELDQLHWLSLNIDNLHMPDPTYSCKSNLNFKFLLKMKQLRCFYTNFDSSKLCYLTCELFRCLKYFWCIKYFYENQSVSINTDKAPNEYSFRTPCYNKSGLDFNGLIRTIYAFKSRHIIVDQNLFYYSDPDDGILEMLWITRQRSVPR